MQKENVVVKKARRGNTQKILKNNQVNIPELVSGSSTQAVTQQRPQRQALKMPKQVRQYPYLIRLHGFTLIELLVVVLIIGILAAVAVPQYQKVVKRTRGREVLVALDALEKAQALYYLKHGYYGCTSGTGPECRVYREDLEIEIPRLKYFQYSDPTRSDQFQYSEYDPYSFVVYISHPSLDMQVKARWYRGNVSSIVCSTEDKALIGECNKYFECKEEWRDDREYPDGFPEAMRNYFHRCLLAGRFW